MIYFQQSTKSILLFILSFSLIFISFSCEKSKKNKKDKNIFNIAKFSASHLFMDADKVQIEFLDSLIIDGKKTKYISVREFSSNEVIREITCPPVEGKYGYKFPFNWIVHTNYSYSDGSSTKSIYPDTLTVFTNLDYSMPIFKTGKVDEIEIGEHNWRKKSDSIAEHDIWIVNNSENEVSLIIFVKYFSSRGVVVHQSYVKIDKRFTHGKTEKVSINVDIENAEIIKTSLISIDSIFYD